MVIEFMMQTFKNIYMDPDPSYKQYHLPGLFPSLSVSDLANISCMVDDIEIHKAFCDMGPTKAPGIDGLHAVFYQSQWPNVGRFVCSFIREIFAGKDVPHEINKTLLVLIPKKENPDSLKLFRPISLYTVIYKSITKIIVNRIKHVLSKLIGPVQTSFDPGRNISDNGIIAQEIIHSMRKKHGRSGFMAIKVDLEKAYDMLKWEFIWDTLQDDGFPIDVANLVMNCITSSSMQVLWNGESTSKFFPSRGF